MRGRLLFLPALLLSVGSWASEPGQPLDCSDWVFLEPGHSCVVEIAPRECGASCTFQNRDLEIDNLGRRYVIKTRPIGYCPCGGIEKRRTSLVRLDGGNGTEIAYFEDRCFECGAYGGYDLMFPKGGLVFDRTNGKMLIPLGNGCYPCTGCSACPYSTADGDWLAAITGFAATFEMFQTYDPLANELGFLVPVVPEGLPAADHFDTYYGPLANPIDFTQAQPLQCDYPASPPQAGDYLTVADTLPNPTAGTGRYYVTAVTHQGQTRYGRKASGGRLSGRDPAVLPGCVVPSGGE